MNADDLKRLKALARGRTLRRIVVDRLLEVAALR